MKKRTTTTIVLAYNNACALDRIIKDKGKLEGLRWLKRLTGEDLLQCKNFIDEDMWRPYFFKDKQFYFEQSNFITGVFIAGLIPIVGQKRRLRFFMHVIRRSSGHLNSAMKDTPEQLDAYYESEIKRGKGCIRSSLYQAMQQGFYEIGKEGEKGYRKYYIDTDRMDELEVRTNFASMKIKLLAKIKSEKLFS